LTAYGWRTEHSVKDWLFAEAYRFDFFQAVKLLEALRPQAEPMGDGVDPAREAVRFRSTVRLDFPASDVEEVAPPSDEESPAEMQVNFLGLAGAEGPLPLPFVETILERVRQKDTGLRDFLDIFNHRLVSLMYRGRKAHLPALTSTPPDQGAVAGYLFSLIGLGQPPLRHRLRVPDAGLLFYAGLLCQRPRSAVGLERILADFFQVGVRVRQLTGTWREIEPDECTTIGSSGKNQTLGQGAVLGKRVWDQQGAFEIQLGPLSLARFEDFLPGGSAYGPLRDLIRFYVGLEFDFSVRLTVEASEVPESHLGVAKLGWISWLRTRSFESDDSQVSLSDQSAELVGVGASARPEA
jgi:type VI secretion system protein ImpH